MPIQPLQTYDLDEVFAVIGPVGDVSDVRIDGYSDDGGITFDIEEDLGSLNIGADGLPVFSRNHNRLVTATLTLSEMSKTVKRLDALIKAQRSQSPIEACPFFMRDTINGDTISEEFAVFMNQPAPSKEAEAGSREFQIWLPNARDKILLGTEM